MAHERNIQTITLPAATNLSASQFKFVKVNSSGQAALCGDGETAIGVLGNKPAAAGEAALIVTGGVAKVEVNSAIAAGGDVASGANGEANTPATNDQIIGVALEAAVLDGDIIPVLIQHRGLAV